MTAAQVTALLPALSITEPKKSREFEAFVKDSSFIDYINEFPYLNDQNTIEFIEQSKVMFINRGLPGSGKSTLSKKIKELYGSEKTVVCSADDFFTDKDGNYNWVENKLGEAHFTAYSKAENGCM